jgi:hypothetical protein
MLTQLPISERVPAQPRANGLPSHELVLENGVGHSVQSRAIAQRRARLKPGRTTQVRNLYEERPAGQRGEQFVPMMLCARDNVYGLCEAGQLQPRCMYPLCGYRKYTLFMRANSSVAKH